MVLYAALVRALIVVPGVADGADDVVSVSEVHVVIRLALVRRDRRHDAAHREEAEGLHAALTEAYRAGGGYVATCAGQRYYYASELLHAAQNIASASPSSSSSSSSSSSEM